MDYRRLVNEPLDLALRRMDTLGRPAQRIAPTRQRVRERPGFFLACSQEDHLSGCVEHVWRQADPFRRAALIVGGHMDRGQPRINIRRRAGEERSRMAIPAQAEQDPIQARSGQSAF